MDSFLGKTRQFFQGLPSSTRGYGGSALKDEGPNPTPPATPTLPPAHAYHPHLMTGAIPASSVPGLLPPSRPMTPVTPSHKPVDHSSAASPYSVASFLHPPVTKSSLGDARYLAQYEQHRQAALASGVSAASSRPGEIHSQRASSQSPSRSYSSPQSSVSHDGRPLMPLHNTHAPGTVELRPMRPYSGKHPLPGDARAYSYPYGSHNSIDSRGALFDSKYFPRPESRPPDSRISESRSDPRTDQHQEQWSPYRPPDKSIERLTPSVHIAEPSASVNGSKDALYLGKKTEDNTLIRKTVEPLQVNGSRDPLYPNGSYSAPSSEAKRDSSSERTVSQPREDSALDLSVKTVRQTPDSTAPDLEKSHSSSPHSGVNIDKVPAKDSQRRTPISVPVTSPFRTPSRDPSPAHVSELIKNTPGISGTVRGASPSHASQYGVTGSPRPLQSPSPLARTSHMLPPTKRTGDPSYFDHLPKLPRLSHTPPSKISTSQHIAENPLLNHSRDRPLPSSHKEGIPDASRGLHLLAAATINKEHNIRYSGESTIERVPLHVESRDPSFEWRDRREPGLERRDLSTERKEFSYEVRRDLNNERRDVSLERRDVSLERRDAGLERKDAIERRDAGVERRDAGLERRDASLERRDASLERRDVSLERRDVILERRDLSLERRDLSLERRDMSYNRKDLTVEGKEPSYDRRDLTLDPKYAYGKHHPTMAPPTDPYSNWLMPQDYLKPNSLVIERQKYIPGQKPMPTSVPTSLPQQNSRLPSAPHSYSSYKLPSETRLPQTSYSQASHTGASTHSSQFNPAQSTPAKAHQVYGQPPVSKTNQIPATQSSSAAQSHAAPGQANSAPQPHPYPYPYGHTVAAHYAQQQLRQQKSSSVYPSFSLPPSNKSSSSSSLPPPLLTPQQSAHQAYLYAQHRNETSLAMYQAKRSNQLSPHPSGSPHPSASPHPTASPNTAASPHPSASPHHKAASPHSTVSPHPGQQSRIPQYSPHAAQRPPSASATQHPSQGYPGSLPPSPYSSHQSHTSHTTPPSSRPPSATSQHSHQSQPQHSPYSSQGHSSQPLPSPVQPPPPHTSQSSQSYPVSSQAQSPHPPPSHPPPHSSQSRTAGPTPPQSSHSSQPRPHPSVSTTQSYHSHVTSQYSTYHTQANIYSQPHPTWTTQSYSSHIKTTDGHHSQGHHPSQSHSYLPQGYPPHSQSIKPPNSQANLPQSLPPQAYQIQPHPSQAHPPHPHTSHPHPHPPTAHPPQSHLPLPHAPQSHAPPVRPPQSQAPPSHPPHSNAPLAHPPHSNAPLARPPHSNAPPAHPPQSHVPPAYPPQSHPPPSHPSPSHPPPSHPSQPYPPLAHPPQSSSSQTHPPQPHSSQVPPPHPYPSKPHPPHVQASLPHAPQILSTQGHPRPPLPTQTFPPQPHQPLSHPSQSHSSQTHPQQPHTTHTQAPQPHHAHAHLPQPHSLQGSPPQAHPSRPPSQAPTPHPHHAHPTHPHSLSQSQPPQSYPAQTHPPQTHSSQSHPPQSHAVQAQPTQSQSSQLQPHSSQAPQEPSKAPPPESHSSQVYPPHSHHSQSNSADPHSKSSQSHSPQPPQPPVVQPPKGFPHQTHTSPAHSATHPPPSQAPPSQAHHIQAHPSQSSQAPHPSSSPQVGHSQGHAPQPHSPRGHPLQGQTHSHSQSHSPRGYAAQPHSPRSHPAHPSPSQPHMYPPHDYPSQAHPSYDHHVQAYTPQGHSSRIHHAPSHPPHPQMRLPYPSIRHPYPPTTQSQPAHQKHPPYVSQPPVPHSTPGHIPEPHHHSGYSHHGQHPYYPPPHPSHQTAKLEGTGSTAHYPPYTYPSPHVGSRPEMQISGGASLALVQQPIGVSSTSKQSQEYDPSRIRTKGEQKSFDPRNADGAKSSGNAESQPGYPPNNHSLTQLQSADASEPHKNSSLASESLHASFHADLQKSSTVCREEEKIKTDQLQATGKTVEPGKAALAEKLHKKLQHAESVENLVIKRENVPECVLPIKEEPVEDEWDKGFDRLMEDLAANPEGVTSKKSRSLGRRYLQKVQIQDAIEHDLIAPPILIEEEEEESEPEAPVKFRGKFKSIKDKKVERLILTYASHSDESAVEMIPDDDASDFEEELKREIRLKSKKRGHSKRTVVADSSTGSEAENKIKKRGSTRGRNKENKPNNKQDSDYSYSSSSSSESISSSSSDDSDTEDSDSESARPRRRGRKSDIEQIKKGKKWESDSSDSEEEFVPKRRTRRGHKYSSDDDSFRPSQRNKKRKKKQDSSDSEEIPVKTRRGKKSESDSEEEEKIMTGRGKRRVPLGKRFKKRQKDESDEDSEKETPRKTRGMKKKVQDSKERRRNQISASSSSDSEKLTNKKGRKKVDLRKKIHCKDQSKEDTSEDSDIPTKKKHSSKSHVIVDSDDSETNSRKDSPTEKILKKDMPKEKESSPINERESEKEPSEGKDPQEEEAPEDFDVEENEVQREPDTVLEKLKKIRDEELNREDVQEMKVWLGEVSRDIEKQLGNVQDVAFRNYWKKPQFGAGEDFLQGWQNDVKKYKEISARFPKKLCLAAKHQVTVSGSKTSPRKGRDQEASKESPRRALSSPAKNTRSKSGIIKTSMSVAEDERLKVAARPEISSVMQRFFEKVLADSNNDSAKEESCRKFNLDPFPAFGTQRLPTGLTPTPSVAPSMLASDDSDLDSLASLRMDLPASDSVPVSRRSIASSLLKKIGRKYNDKKLNTMYLTKARTVMQVTNKPQLLPTPGMPTSEKDLEEMSPDQLKLNTFFRKETVNNYRRNFESIITKNGINEFTPILCQSRTRNKTRQIQDAATIKSVFGFDIPPHILKKKEAKQTKKVTKKLEKKEDVKKEESPAVPVSRASTPGGLVLAQGDDDDDSELRSERSESVLGESSTSHVPKRVKRKFRKFRSGFDYIRKKKKVKADDEATPSRKRLPVRKHVNWPEQSRDVASEVRTWVVNKGLGETVLHKAARLGYHDVVVYCAESPDFDINVRDNAGYTPLHEACNRGHLDIAQVLCVHGAHVNAPGYKGMRPLHEAVENGHGELARLLLAYGADPTLTTYAGQTCLALSADIQTTRLVEGFMADLKGQRISDMWYFAGPARLLDPEEQGCDIFGSLPGSNTLQSTDLKCLEESNRKTEDVTKLEITSTDDSVNGQTALSSDTNILLLKEVKVEGVVSEQKSSLTESHDPKVLQKTKAVGESDDQEKIKSETVSECKSEDANASETKETRADADSANDDDKTDKEWELKELIFETSELPMLDLFEVEGRPHKYHLLLELLAHLKMTYKEFVVSATSVETLELTIEEFESRAHSGIVGSCSRDIVNTCSRVVLVRVTPSIQKLLGIEAVKL